MKTANDAKQGERSQISKVGNPYRGGSHNRVYYYTDISFTLDDEDIELTVKVDTGASHTVIGLLNEDIEHYTEKIISSEFNGEAYDASGSKLELKGYVVENFQITEDITIPKILIWFSKDMKDKAVLGMDILSLFDFQYLRDKHSTNGTFWVNNYTPVLKKIERKIANLDIDYLDPGNIFILEGKDVFNEQKVENKKDEYTDSIDIHLEKQEIFGSDGNIVATDSDLEKDFYIYDEDLGRCITRKNTQS